MLVHDIHTVINLALIHLMKSHFFCLLVKFIFQSCLQGSTPSWLGEHATHTSSHLLCEALLDTTVRTEFSCLYAPLLMFSSLHDGSHHWLL